MKNCTLYQKNLPLYVYNELPEIEQAELEAHLQVCPTCRAALEETRQTIGFIPQQSEFDHLTEILPGFRKLLSLKLRAKQTQKRQSRIFFSFISGRPAFQVAFAALLVLTGFLLGRQQTAPQKGNENALLQQILASSQKIRFSNGELNPFLGQIERIKLNPETGSVEIEYQTVNDVAIRGNLENNTIQQLLQQALQEESNQAVRLHAVKALTLLTDSPGQLNSKIIDDLILLLKKEENTGVRLQILKMLKSLPLDENIKNILVHVLLYDQNEALRIEAFKILTGSNLARQEQKSLLRKARLDSNSYIQYQAEEKLEQLQKDQNNDVEYL